MRNIVEEIEANYNKMTKSQRKIGDFIIENYSIVPFETISSIAARVGQSTTSLIRFSRMLGYRDYSDLKYHIQESIKGKISLPARLKNTASDSADTADASRDFSVCRDNAVNNIDKTIKYMNKADLDEAIELICRTKRTYVLGLRSCFSPAYLFSMVLSQIKTGTRLIHGIGNVFPEEIIDVNKDDLLVVFTFPRFYKETLNLASYMHRYGAKVILITSNQHEHIKQYGDIILPVYVNGISFKDSFVAVIFLIEYIISEVVRRNKKESLKTISKLEELLSQSYFMGF